MTTGPDILPAAKRRRIKPLPTLVANQIAAGEVVERPASVVKELVENSLDAGATRIRVELEQGGIELVRIVDDGSGIEPDDLPLAVAPHATSKIDSAEDLEHVATLGFRGEALASIASVARVEIRSRTPASAQASVLRVEGNVAQPVQPAAGPVGTSITVRTLFFNTPARRKFLRTVPTEQGRCLDALKDLAMAHPNVAFEAVCDGRKAMDLPRDQTPAERAVAILGGELRDQLLEVSSDEIDRPGSPFRVLLWGLVGRPSIARPTNKSQHVFINGRAVRDRTIQHAIAEAYRGIIEPGRYPTAVLLIDMPPGAVDVNVHPAKAEVRFRDSSLIHSVVLEAVRRALRAADLTPTFASISRSLRPGEERAIMPGAGLAAGAPAIDAESARRKFIDFFSRPAAQPEGRFDYQQMKAALDAPAPAPASLLESAAPSNSADGVTSLPLAPPVSASPAPGLSAPILPAASGALPTEPSLTAPKPIDRILQVHNSFLVTQDEQGVVIIDQHALHERVMFEGLLARLGEGNLEGQALLVPAVVDVAPVVVEQIEQHRPMFERLGLDVQALGPRSLGVRAFPTFLFDRGVEPGEFLPDLFERLADDSSAARREEAFRDVLDMMACKAAVKAGDRLTPTELDKLVELRDAVERSSNCPHGRPTSIRLTIRELEKLFGRG
ncbi:MAG: DNA mismatch repair endonuclease MutL [Planctomycetota bacterium]|nr:DNA mismatch repair endonuclease MutL [Planctomycetota bacterium]